MPIPAHWRVIRETVEDDTGAATMPAIEIPGVATVRQLPADKLGTLWRLRGPNADIAFLAFPAGLTVRQFKRLPAEQRSEIREAVWTLVRM